MGREQSTHAPPASPACPLRSDTAIGAYAARRPYLSPTLLLPDRILFPENFFGAPEQGGELLPGLPAA